MTTLIVGESLGVTERTAGPANRPADQWQERVLNVLSEAAGRVPQIVRVKLAREFRGAEPSKGEMVAVEVSIGAYAKRKRGTGTPDVPAEFTGEADYDVTGFGRVAEVERLLASSDAAESA